MKNESGFFTDTIVIRRDDKSTEPAVSDTSKTGKFHFEPLSLTSEICTSNAHQIQVF